MLCVILLLGPVILGAWIATGWAEDGEAFRIPREEPFVTRPFSFPTVDGHLGLGIAYGPHRDGQRPGGPSPERAQIAEDLRLMAPHWAILRVYGSSGFARTMLEEIHHAGLDLKVVLGVWIGVEERRDASGRVEELPEARRANRREIEAAVDLAAEFPKIVSGISVGNETQVSWSDHRIPVELLIRYIREVRSRTAVPVTAADDFNFWNKPESGAVGREVDFIAVHMHPLWNGVRLKGALAWIRETYTEIRDAHPDRPVVIAETGWATSMHHAGEQARLIKGATGEREQAAFYRRFKAWMEKEPIPTFIFEAFDEHWKGGTDDDDVEKHWGLYRADRTPKLALRDGE